MASNLLTESNVLEEAYNSVLLGKMSISGDFSGSSTPKSSKPKKTTKKKVLKEEDDEAEDTSSEETSEDTSTDEEGGDTEESTDDSSDESSNGEDSKGEEDSEEKDEEDSDEKEGSEDGEEDEEENEPEYEFVAGRVCGFSSPRSESWCNIMQKYGSIPYDDEDVMVAFGSSLRSDIKMIARDNILFKVRVKNEEEDSENLFEVRFSTFSNKFEVYKLNAKTKKRTGKKLEKEEKDKIINSELFKDEILPQIKTDLQFLKEHFGELDEGVIESKIDVDADMYDKAKQYIQSEAFMQAISKKKIK